MTISSIKPRTRDYWRQRLAALIKSWPGLNETEVRNITQPDCKKWASAYGKTASPTNYNNTIALLRHVLNVAIEAGVIYSNPAAALKRAPIRGKEIALPTIDKFNALIAEMRAGHSRDSRNCGDFAYRLGRYRNAQGRSATRYNGAISILTLEKSLCVAMPRRARRIGDCAVCR